MPRLPWRRDPTPPPGPLAELADVPPPSRSTLLSEVEILALDVETTGLRPRRDELLSFGLVPVLAGEVLLGGTRHLAVRPRGDVGGSAVVHGLTDDVLTDAPPLAQVLPEVLRAFVGPGYRRVLLAHFAQVETSFLASSCLEVYGASVPFQVVDTLELERRLMRAQHHELPQGTLRLDACRRRHGLPRYAAHRATTDAVACAELFLAQCAELESRRGRPLVLDDVAERGLA
ncbi:exonuclease domain-containing protein [Ornithinimicrobium cerasi]|uniref:exonuclease domain-containing protein n=1 Tax=Ornithinimicrobium cerasi TaxID=2248773 RepID=UPI000F0009D8|nr:exonuclease domain-containing protein [Ornithinimicrobium cerasi]